MAVKSSIAVLGKSILLRPEPGSVRIAMMKLLILVGLVVSSFTLKTAGAPPEPPAEGSSTCAATARLETA